MSTKQQQQQNAVQALPTRLSRAVASTRKKLNPSPPRFNVVLKPSSPTFSLEYLTRTITVPGFWKEFKQKLLLGFLGHEHKHGSIDGLPFNFVNRKKHEAACMGALNMSAHQAGRLLNCVYDSVDYDEPILILRNGRMEAIKIGAFVENFMQSETETVVDISKQGISAACFNDSYKLEFSPISAVSRKRMTSDFHELVLTGGRRVRVSPSHSVYVLADDLSIQSVEVGQLKANDQILVPLRLPKVGEVEQRQKINLVDELDQAWFQRTVMVTNLRKEVLIGRKEQVRKEAARYHTYHQTLSSWVGLRRIPLAVAKRLRLTSEELENALLTAGRGKTIRAIIHVDASLSRCLGYLVSEGSIGSVSSEVSVTFSRAETELVQDYCAALSDAFGASSKTLVRKSSINAYTYNKCLNVALKHVFDMGSRAKLKRVPNVIFNVSSVLQLEFLKAVCRGDGCYSGVGTGRATISTVSRELATGLSFLFLMNDTRSTITHGVNRTGLGKKPTEVYQVNVSGQKSPELCTDIARTRGVRRAEGKRGWEKYMLLPRDAIATGFNSLWPALQTMREKRTHKDAGWPLRSKLRGWLDLPLVKRRIQMLELLSQGAKSLKEIGATNREFVISRDHSKMEKRGLLLASSDGRYALTESGAKTLRFSRNLSLLLEGDVGTARILRIEQVKPTSPYMYDICVPGRENFIGGLGAVCLHNSVINVRLAEQGFALKEAQQAWANKFPVTQGEGGEYHLLQVVFKHLLKITLPKTGYEASVKQKPEFKQLLETVQKLIRQQDAMDQEKDVDTIVLAVRLFSELIERKDDDDGEGRLCTDGNDEPVPAELAGEVAEAAADAGLDAGQLKELLNDPDVTEEEAERALNEAEEGRANSAIWHSLIAFKGFEGSGGRTIKEPLLVRWSGHSVSRLDPTSVAVHADDPSKWRERKARPFATIPQPTDDSGFEEVIAVLDMSGSTKLVFGGRQVFAYEKDAAYSALAFARKQRLSFTLVTFEDDASIVVQRDGDPLKAAKLLSHMRPTDNGSELGPAVSLCVAMHPLRALVVIITDGHVSTGDTAPLLQVSDRNEVVCMVVAPSVTDNALLSAYGDRLTTFQVKPDSAGHALIAQLGARLRKNR